MSDNFEIIYGIYNLFYYINYEHLDSKYTASTNCY